MDTRRCAERSIQVLCTRKLNIGKKEKRKERTRQSFKENYPAVGEGNHVGE
jgi:hypothetical protein